MIEVAVIGAGPAGLAAAMQLTRQRMDCLVFEADVPGGLLHNANLVENYPGFPGGIPGPRLAALFQEQAEQLGVRIHRRQVRNLTWQDQAFLLTTDQGARQAEKTVVATGTRAVPFQDVPVSSQAAERIFTEVADLSGVKGKRILIIGAGDAAFDYALNLSRENQVTILNRSGRILALGLLQQRVKFSSSIKYHADTIVKQIAGGGPGNLLVSVHKPTGEEVLSADYLLTAIGRIPADEFIDQSLLDPPAAGIPAGSLFFVGDIRSGRFRQTAMAVGDGVRAAMEIYFRKEKE